MAGVRYDDQMHIGERACPAPMHHGTHVYKIVVARNDFEQEKLDLEVGFSLTRSTNANIRIAGGRALAMSELPAIETMATIVRSGPGYESHRAFGAIGGWMEAHSYEIAGPCREVFLEPMTRPPNLDDVLVEIQFPVRRAA